MKSVKKPRSVGSIFNATEHLRELLASAQKNTDLLLQVQGLLPQAIRAHCHAAHLRDGQLVLFTDSPAWVMRLRFCSSQLVQGLGATGSNVRGIRVRVQLPERVLRRRKSAARLSEGTRQQLRETAEHLDNPALAEALKRLSRARRP